MLKNPFVNAILATLYIGVVVTILHFTSSFTGESFFIPIAVLSLLVLSVSIMGVLFFYEPVCLLIEKDQKGALVFLAKALGTFALLTAFSGVLILLFSNQPNEIQILN